MCFKFTAGFPDNGRLTKFCLIVVMAGCFSSVGTFAAAQDKLGASTIQTEADTDLDSPLLEWGIIRDVISGGGGRSSRAIYVVHGTVGQVEADPLQPSASADGLYTLTGGFWSGLASAEIGWLFSDGFEGVGN